MESRRFFFRGSTSIEIQIIEGIGHMLPHNFRSQLRCSVDIVPLKLLAIGCSIKTLVALMLLLLSSFGFYPLLGKGSKSVSKVFIVKDRPRERLHTRQFGTQKESEENDPTEFVC